MVWLLMACVGEVDSGGPRACNGHESLCERPFDQVVLPGTHNSMSNADAGWWFPNQQHGLTRQLEDGVRGFLLDTYDEDGELLLCHGSCGLGSQPLVEGLGELADFLEANPDEVLALILQDATTPEQTAQAFQESGLLEYVYTHDGAWPTLGEMADANARVLVTLESGREGVDWLYPAWTMYSDTAWSYPDVEAMECSLNRGAEDSPLFLLNHWIGDVPSAWGGEQANAQAVLEDRVAECLQERGRLPSLVAVDFYDQGQLFEVVAALNEG